MKKIALLAALLVSACFSVVAPLQSQPHQFRGGPAHPGAADYSGEVLFDQEAWRFAADGPIRGTPAGDGSTAFFGTGRGTFYALDLRDGAVRWTFPAGSAVNSSPAVADGLVFFSSRRTLYCLDAGTGKTRWTFDFGPARPYPWGFDYYCSSPALTGSLLLTGSDDGFLYALDPRNGRLRWKYDAGAPIHSAPAADGETVYAGDMDGVLHAVRLTDGKQAWTYRTKGYSFKNEDFGFDRRALLGAPAVHGDLITVGGRDGFLYAVRKDGSLAWSVDYQVSWVISAPAARDGLVVTGTSDGRYINALNLSSGEERWRFRTRSIVWSSPLLINDRVYCGSGESVLYILDLHSGRKLSEFRTGANIFSSPVLAGDHLLIGADDGVLHALRPRPEPAARRRFVFWEPDRPYFSNEISTGIRNYLTDNDYQPLDSTALLKLLDQPADSVRDAVIVFAANFFPARLRQESGAPLLHNFLEAGGRLLVLGPNPLIYIFNDSGSHSGFNFQAAEKPLGLHYGPNDLRAFKGLFPAFATDDGVRYGLSPFWISPLGIDPGQVDRVLGTDENGLAAAWIKNVGKGAFIQLWADAGRRQDYQFIRLVAEAME